MAPGTPCDDRVKNQGAPNTGAPYAALKMKNRTDPRISPYAIPIPPVTP